MMLLLQNASLMVYGQQHPRQHIPFVTDTPMVHDPVMAYEDSTYHIFATGMGIQHMTSVDRKNWTVHAEPVMSVIPHWTHDSVPGFTHHVWAPDIIQYRGKWWMAYSCSTFGKNGSAIGLLSARKLAFGMMKVASLLRVKGVIIGMLSIPTLLSTTTISLGWYGALSGMAYSWRVLTLRCILQKVANRKP